MDPVRELPYGPAACDSLHQRPDTCQHPTTRSNQPKTLLLQPGRSLIAAPPSSLSFILYIACLGHGSLRGQHELPQHPVRSTSAGIARSTTGLRLITCPWPRPRNCLHPRPGATRSSAGYRGISMRYAAIAGGVQRNGSPERQTLCRMTDSLRAKATRALPGLERRSIATAQSFK